jgi:GTPase
MGPVNDGSFKQIQIKNIQFLRKDVNEVYSGNSCSLKLKSLDKNYELSTECFRKGMVLVSPDEHLSPALEFEIEALIVHHSSTIKCGYQSVIHCNVVRQTATIVEMSKDCMRAGDSGVIKFRFLKSPEYLHLGDIVLFREGRTRGKGRIIKLYPFVFKKNNVEKTEKKVNQGKGGGNKKGK